MVCKGYRIALIVLLFPVLACAQNADYRFHLRSGALAATENLEEFIATSPTATETVEGRYFRLVQFFSTPNVAARAQIEATGIRFLAYIPNRAYIMSIPQHWDRTQLRQFNVRGVHRLEAQHKIKQNLRDRPLPTWALNAPGKVDMELNVYPGLDQLRIRQKLTREGLVLLENTYPGVISVRADIADIERIAALPYVSYLEPINPPATPDNYTGRTLHRGNMIASDHAMGRQYDGSGVVVAMGDDGIIGPHIDYQGRTDQSRVSTNNGNHGDHVGGIIMGAGNLNPKNRGNAFGATLHVYQVWNAVINAAQANQQDGVMLTSTSYSDGCNAGYTSFAQGVDQMTRENPTLLHVFSAGNNGTSDCGYGAGAGWGNVTGGVKIGKNVIAVANLTTNSGLAGSSSRGPTEDGRIKPEIGAKGTSVASTIDVHTYANFTGTSMSCPGVSGTTAQLIHAYRALHGQADPKSGLMKAILMNTADDLGNPGPDFRHGYGQINAYRAVRTLENATWLNDSIDQAGSNTHQISVPTGTAELKIMIYWHDYEGAVQAFPALVNNLDMTVSDPAAGNHLPWILDHAPNGAALNSPATPGIDSINNQEQVTVLSPTPGNWTVTISGMNVPFGLQEYFLVYEFRDSSVTLTYPNGGEGFAPNETEKIRWDATGDYGTWDIDYTTNNGSTWTNAATGIAGDQRHADVTVPNLQSGEVRYRISRGGFSDESDHNLSVIRVPGNLTVENACPTYVVLDWDSLGTASSYDVFMLGATYMDSIGTTTNSFFRVNGTDPNQEYWFAVRARGADGARGRRTIAILKSPGIWNCLEPDDAGIQVISAPGNGIYQSCAGGSAMTISVLIENFSPNPMTNIPCFYSVDGGAAVSELFMGMVPGHDTATFTFSTTATLSNGAHTLDAWATFPTDAYNANDSAFASVEVYAGVSVTVPYREDFESQAACAVGANCGAGTCALTNDWLQGGNAVTDDIDWRTDAAGTQTPGTGPSMDHNPGVISGKYLYTEASNCFGQVATLVTPCLDLTNATQPYFTFWFHFYGGTTGELHVDIFADGRWQEDVTSRVFSDWTNKWWERQIDLTAYAGKVVNIRFRGITGPGAESDMAIDDVHLTEGPPVNLENPIFSSGLKVFPNPNKGIFRYELPDVQAENIQLSVVDITGSVVIRQEISKFTEDLSGEIDLSNEANGLYFLKIIANGANFGSKIAVKK